MASTPEFSEFVFDVEAISLDTESDYIARVPPLLSSRSELFSALRDALQLPSYFGQNWDALSECLRDLSWIGPRRVILMHDDVPPLSEQELAAYLDVLSQCVPDWKAGEEHQLVVVFPRDSRERIAQIVSRSQGAQEQAKAEPKEWATFSAGQLAKQYSPEDAAYDQG